MTSNSKTGSKDNINKITIICDDGKLIIKNLTTNESETERDICNQTIDEPTKTVNNKINNETSNNPVDTVNISAATTTVKTSETTTTIIPELQLNQIVPNQSQKSK